MIKIVDSVRNNIFPSIIVTASLAFVIPLIFLFDGISKRYISNNLVPYDVGQGEISQFFFLYIDKGIVDTIFTMAFWALVAVIGIFIVWVMMNTYYEISNILVIDTEFSNKDEHYLLSVSKLIAVKALASLGAIFVLLFFIKTIVPQILKMIAENLFVDSVTVSSVGMTLLWYLVLVIALELLWLLAVYTYRFIKV